MSLSIRTALFALLAVTLTACATGGPQFNYSGVAATPGILGAGATVRVVHSQSPKHVNTADEVLAPQFRAELKKKGYADGGDQATYELAYEVRVQELSYMEQKPIVTPGGVAIQRNEMQNTRIAGLAVVVVEVATGKQVYAASTSGELQQTPSDDLVRELAIRALDRFPRSAAKPKP